MYNTYIDGDVSKPHNYINSKKLINISSHFNVFSLDKMSF